MYQCTLPCTRFRKTLDFSVSSRLLIPSNLHHMRRIESVLEVVRVCCNAQRSRVFYIPLASPLNLQFSSSLQMLKPHLSVLAQCKPAVQWCHFRLRLRLRRYYHGPSASLSSKAARPQQHAYHIERVVLVLVKRNRTRTITCVTGPTTLRATATSEHPPSSFVVQRGHLVFFLFDALYLARHPPLLVSWYAAPIGYSRQGTDASAFTSGRLVHDLRARILGNLKTFGRLAVC
ncbi:hypothetical protein EDD17DRAFT_1055251 [Pisolithus thermaeus]|nr:hypothetical protein EDD17DRAFT_1055251 [Pisolithus thermaeus]